VSRFAVSISLTVFIASMSVRVRAATGSRIGTATGSPSLVGDLQAEPAPPCDDREDIGDMLDCFEF